MRYLLLLLALLFATPANADINYQVYRAGGPTPCWGCGQALNSGTAPNINFDWGSGIVMNSGLYDGVEVHFTGWITVPGSGSQYITFYDWSDDGFYMYVNGQTVISNWREQGAGYWNGAGGITLVGGQSYYIDVWYYENGGAARVALYWNQGGSVSLVPSGDFATTQPNPKAFGDGGQALPPTSISSTQQIAINQTLTSHNLVYIDQSAGDHTYVKVTQTGDHNMFKATMTGSYQSITSTQTGNYNYEESILSGGSNTITNTQDGSKALFQNVSGSNNNITTSQTGGNHFLELNIPTNGNTVNVTQSGAAQKLFSLTINSPNVGVTVQQTNATVSDSASMTITCNSGPCTGYTYTKN